MAEEQLQQQVEAARREGKVSATVRGATANQVWSLLADFCNIHRWIPGVSTCRLDGGVAGEPGCIRYCAGEGDPVDGGDVAWARERLTGIDHAGRKLSYVVIGNNIGWKSYEAALEVVEEEEGDGCTIEWFFTMEPDAQENGVDAVPFVTSALQGMVKRMEDFLTGGGGGGGGDGQESVGTVVA